MKLRIYILLILVGSILPITSCNLGQNGSNGNNNPNVPVYVMHVEEVNTESWRHIDNLPNERPIAAVLLGVLNDNWDRLQYQLELKPLDILQEFRNVFLSASNTDETKKINDVIVTPVQTTVEEALTVSGTTEDIIKATKSKIILHNFNAGFLMRIDYYEPGAKFSPSGTEFNPEMKLSFWFVNKNGQIIWSAQTAVRTVKPLNEDIAIDHEKSVIALLNRAYEEVTLEFSKFWQSPEVIARMQAAKIVNIVIPKSATGTSKNLTPEFSRPIGGGASTLEGAGFSEEGD